MYIGNIFLLILNLPLIGLWVQILRIPYILLFPLIFLFTLVGSYSLNNDVNDTIITIVSGIFGYLMKKFDFEPAPLIMALILGPMFEDALRQSLVLSNGSPWIFFSRPISAVLLLGAIILLISPVILKFFGRKRPGLSDY
jgi:putative tricarboxylic transport membrane protein